MQHEAPTRLFLDAARLNSILKRFDSAAAQCIAAMGHASSPADKIECLTELGSIYYSSGKLELARKTLSQAVQVQKVPRSTLIRPYSELGQTERDMGKTAEARAKIQTAIELAEQEAVLPPGELGELLRAHGSLSYDLEDFDEAAKSFRGAADHYPETGVFHWSSLLWLARCEADLQHFDPARAHATTVAESLFADVNDRDDARGLLAGLEGR